VFGGARRSSALQRKLWLPGLPDGGSDTGSALSLGNHVDETLLARENRGEHWRRRPESSMRAILACVSEIDTNETVLLAGSNVVNEKTGLCSSTPFFGQ
jgi:hypothetical protein